MDLFESLFAYSQLDRLYGMNLTQLISAIEEKRPAAGSSKRLGGLLGRNQLAWDLGVAPADFDNETAVRAQADRLEAQFDLVLVTEMMDESLVLLQDLLCWPVEAVAHLHLNQRRPEATVPLTASQRDVLKSVKWRILCSLL